MADEWYQGRSPSQKTGKEDLVSGGGWNSDAPGNEGALGATVGLYSLVRNAQPRLLRPDIRRTCTPCSLTSSSSLSSTLFLCSGRTRISFSFGGFCVQGLPPSHLLLHRVCNTRATWLPGPPLPMLAQPRWRRPPRPPPLLPPKWSIQPFEMREGPPGTENLPATHRKPCEQLKRWQPRSATFAIPRIRIG